jgi:Fic family protein
MVFSPSYMPSVKIDKSLARIDAARQKVLLRALDKKELARLREIAALEATHYSTMIEGNRLGFEQVKEVLTLEGHFPGRERDEHEIKGYYAALAQLEQYVAQQHPITEKVIQNLHALVMGDGRTQLSPTPYRDGQNVIRDGASGMIVYMPPEA